MSDFLHFVFEFVLLCLRKYSGFSCFLNVIGVAKRVYVLFLTIFERLRDVLIVFLWVYGGLLAGGGHFFCLWSLGRAGGAFGLWLR